MTFQKWIGLAFCGALVGGCAIHPVQQDRTQIPTAQIVQQIRCETRFAILDKAAKLLEEQSFPDTAKGLAEQRKAAGLAYMLRKNRPFAINTKAIKGELNESEKAFFETYIGTAIAHLFTFDIAEQNVVGAQINPVQLLSAGGLTGVQLGASADFTRSNIRTFAIVETFEELLNDTDLACATYQAVPNFIYPISGGDRHV